MLNKDRIATITRTSTVPIKGEFKYSGNGLNYVFQTPASIEHGKVFFNINKGMIQKSKTKTMMGLSYTMVKVSLQEVIKDVSS